MVRNKEVEGVPESQIVEMKGAAGTAFLFDTSGTHRQGVPMLEPRQAIFYNYHDPSVPLQHEDVNYYRYHPLLLNAAFLGGLSDEDQRILGFGNKTNYIQGFRRRSGPAALLKIFSVVHGAQIRWKDLIERVADRTRRLGG